jgi:hypothetical protein
LSPPCERDCKSTEFLIAVKFLTKNLLASGRSILNSLITDADDRTEMGSMAFWVIFG